jgi:hypothetical protein
VGCDNANCLATREGKATSLKQRLHRRLRKQLKRFPRLVKHCLGECFDPECLAFPLAIPFFMVATLVFAAVVLILSGATSIIDETLLGGGPRRGIGLG